MASSNVQLYPYQQAWINDQSRFKIGLWSRQIGKTFSTTLELVLDCLAAESQGRRKRWVILSRGERQAKEAMDEGVKMHLKAMQQGFKALEYDWEASVKALEVELPGGSRITALPASPDTARGFSASVVADEFAFHKDSRAIWRSLFPVISAGHKIRVISTANGRSGMFYDLMTSQDSAWSKHVVTVHDAIAQGLPRDAEELRRGLRDEDAWRQEYLCEWVDEASAWLTYELINACEHDQAGEPDRYDGNPVYVGNDIARRKDLWVAVALEKVGDVLWLREMRCLHRATFAEQDATIQELMRKYRVARFCLDKTGMGERAAEDYQRSFGEYRVEGVLFTPGNKLIMANLARQVFEDRKIRIPAGDEALRGDLHSLKKIVTPAGNVRFDVGDETDCHADRAWALFLAIYAASTPYSPIEFEALGDREGYEDEFAPSTIGMEGFYDRIY